jgi:hypothetical protein
MDGIVPTIIGIVIICLLLWGLKIIRGEVKELEEENYKLRKQIRDGSK